MESDSISLVDQNNDKEKSSNLETAVNLFKVAVGIGILALPYNMNRAGYLLSPIMMVILSSMAVYANYLMVKIADDKELREANFSKLYLDIIGSFHFKIFCIALFLNYYAVCTGFLVLFVEYFQVLFSTTELYYKFLYALIAFVIIFPMSFIRNFHLFVKYSLIANLLEMTILITLIVYSLNNLGSNTVKIANFSYIAEICGTFVLALEFPGQIFHLRNAMKNPEDFSKVFIIMMVVIISFYLLFSLIVPFGFQLQYLTSNILYGFCEINQYFLVITALYAIALMLTYPLQMAPMVEALESIPRISSFLKRNEGNLCLNNSVRILLNIVIILLSITITNFADFVGLFGNISGLPVQFIYPIYAYNKYMGKRISLTRRCMHYFIVIVSGIACVCATYSSLVTLIDDYN